MSRPEDRDPILPSAPPPYPQSDGQSGPAPPYPNEPPPKYEPPKGDYPAGYQGAYPQQGGYQTIPVQPSVVMVTTTFGPRPQQLQCPHCNAYITTTTVYQAGGLAWLAAGLICLFGCWLGCCLIPFCIGDMQDVQHKCANCNRIVGIYRRLD